MKTLDSKLLREFISKALTTLEGDWVLLGGTLLPALGVEYRATVDIDFVRADGQSETSDTLRLMEIADKLDLPVESINQAAAFFLHKIPGYRRNLVLLARSKKARVLRPNLDLYLVLKIGRLTETDLSDCEAMIAYIRRTSPEELKVPLALKRIQAALREDDDDSARAKRIQALREMIQGIG